VSGFLFIGGTPEEQWISFSQVSGVTFAEVFAMIDELTREGYRFIGWAHVEYTIDGEQVTGPIILPTDPTFSAIGLRFYAHWEPLVHTLTFRYPGPETQETTISIGETYGDVFDRIVLPERETLEPWPFQFIGWFTTPSGSGVQVHRSDIVTADSPRVLYARWRGGGAPGGEIFSFLGNGGTPKGQGLGSSAMSGVTFAEVFAMIEEPTKTGYRFIGWAEVWSTDGEQVTGPIILPTDSTSSAIGLRFYAQWERVAPLPPTPRPPSNGGGGPAPQPSPSPTPEPSPTPSPEPSPELTPTPPTPGFDDVDNDSWYHAYVQFVAKNDIMQGTGEGSFSPHTTLSRAMLATILWRLEGEPEVTFSPVFNDVPSNAPAWYRDAVIWANENRIVQGFDGYFAPHVEITREEFAAMLYRYALLAGVNTSVPESFHLNNFQDRSQLSDWAEDYKYWAVYATLIQGVDSQTLAPGGTATRAQSAAILMRFMQSFVGEK
jgi:hypothetical protein